ncbi:hypothetical protein EJP67_09770 [Variovorax guangxiensis]|uniref:Uncharacterized protein n=1 Tax=Variovorax guangxiensis TaxID=1775474 RepID=A0A3S0XR12_9BURK|nr:hypothetical protein [Variovorax guangxiensis]RUR67347.1 hypothetical protein EJP67_09770 [Variovorax guangxiensis]
MDVATQPVPAVSSYSITSLIPATQAITIQLPPKSQDNMYLGLEPAMWGPVLTGLALLVTTAYQVWNTNRQLKEAREAAARQVESDREQARLDRTLESRKDLFDTFIDDYKKTASLIGDLPSRDMSEAGPDIEELSSMNATVNKIWLWAEVGTVLEVRELQAEINEHFFQAMMQCRPIWLARKRVTRIETKLQQLESEREQYLVAARTFVPYPEPSQDQKQRMISNLLASANAGINQGRVERNNELAEEGRLRSAYLTFVVARSAVLMDRLARIMTLARKELQVEGDTTLLEAQTAQFKRRVSAAIAQVQKELAEEAAKD